MFLYVLVEDIKNDLKLFNNTHLFEPDSDNIMFLYREDNLIPCKVQEAIFIRKATSPTLNRMGERELAKIYDSLPGTPSSRTLPTASSKSGSVSCNSITIR